jgi:cytochrome c oxidase subunit II
MTFDGIAERRTSGRAALTTAIATVWATVWFGSALGLAAGAAVAGTGQPSPGQLNLQNPVTEVARQIGIFHDWVTWVIAAIAVFVLILLIYCVMRFNEKANPVPSKTTHNTALEIAWTAVPILILIAISIPSFRLLFLQYTYPKPDITIKAIGNAWYWEHEYPDQGGFKVTSNMLQDEDVLKAEFGADEYKRRFGNLEDGTTKTRVLYDAAQPVWQKRREPRMLAVDNEIAVPVGKVVHVLITANDVIHSWTIPSFGSKMQAVPGRITHSWFRPEKVGVYYGQCSVLCGKNHASMPIAVRVVEQRAFDEWTAAVKARDMKKAGAILKAATEDPAAPRYAGAPAH